MMLQVLSLVGKRMAHVESSAFGKRIGQEEEVSRDANEVEG